MRTKRITLMVGVVLAIVMSVGWAGGSKEAGTGAAAAQGTAPVKYKDELHIAVAQEAPSLDLHKNSSLIARQMTSGSVWEKLVTLNSKSEVVPELAERYETNADSSEYTFYLRKGVKFHDGTIMTADDVVASMNRWINGFSVAKQLAGKARFVKVDDYTVRITFDHPAVTFLDVMAGAAQPAAITTATAAAKEDTKGFMTDYIGTGPYKFVEWKLNQYTLLEKFDDYVPYGDPSKPVDGWAGYKDPKIKKLYFHYVSEPTTRTAGLETGQYDMDYNVTGDSYDRVVSMDGVKVIRYQAGTVAYVFNKKEGVASNIYFRQAVNAALNFDDVMRAAYGSLYELNSSYMDSSEPFWVSEAGSEYYNQHDAAKAKELLKKAGYNGQPFRILVSTLNGMDRTALVVQQELEAVGIKVELIVVDWATLTQFRTDSSKYDVYVTSFASVPVPSLKLYFGPTYPGWTGTDDPHILSLVDAFNASKTREEAKHNWDVLQGYSWEYLPLMNLGHYNAAMAWSDKVENLNIYSGVYFWNVQVRE